MRRRVSDAANQLDGPYVEYVRAETASYLDQLTRRYEEKYGVRVPRRTRKSVERSARNTRLSAGANGWLEVAIAIAAALRPDLDGLEFRRVFQIATGGDLSFLLNPPPIEILSDIQAGGRPTPASKPP